MLGELKIFSGQSHPDFAEKVCKHIGISPGKLYFKKFANDNMMVKIQENVRGKDVFYIQTSVNPVSDNIIEMLITLDALKHASAGRITAVIPYFPYARSDKKDQPRISIAARLMADLIETAGADRVLTMDLHAPQIQGFFRIPVDQLTGMNILAEYFKTKDLTNYVVVASDIGEAKEAGRFANRINVPVVVIDKRRIGNEDKTEVRKIIGNVNGKHCLLVDDEIATGSTIISAAKFLKEENGAESVTAAVVHPVLCGNAIEGINSSHLAELVTTDTIPVKEKKKKIKKKYVVRTVTKLFAEAIMRIHNGDSISVLFENSAEEECEDEKR